MDLDKWFQKLASLPDMPNVHNLFSSRTEEGRKGLANLRRYFQLMEPYGHKTLLVGEAPGYQGTYRTGIPFTSEYIMLGEINRHGLHGGEPNGFLRIYDEQRVWKEPSATVVQRVLTELKTPPLIWATFPLHPHKPGAPLSNRAPNSSEIALGAELLKDLIKAIKPESVIAVGNIADTTLRGMGVEATKVRHPSHGGATVFTEQIRQLLD